MTVSELFLQLYNTGILALAIMALAMAIVIYPQLRQTSSKKK